MALRNKYVYDKLIKITIPYLGPSTYRFIDRQIINHLGIEPEKLRDTEIKDLIDWMRLSMSLLTENDQTVKEYIQEIELLARGSDEKI
jgi:hypothetical protein